MHLVFHLADNTATAIPVNDLSTVRVQTFTPPRFGDDAMFPQLVDEQSVSLAGVLAVTLDTDAPVGATVVSQGSLGPADLVELTDAEAAMLDAQFETAPRIVADHPWEES